MELSNEVKKINNKHEKEMAVLSNKINVLNSQIDDLRLEKQKANIQHLLDLIPLYGLKVGDNVRLKHSKEIGVLVGVASTRYDDCILDIKKVKKDGSTSKVSLNGYISSRHIETVIKVGDSNE